MSTIFSSPIKPRELDLEDLRRCVMREAAIRRSFDREIERIIGKIAEKTKGNYILNSLERKVKA